MINTVMSPEEGGAYCNAGGRVAVLIFQESVWVASFPHQ